MPTTAGGVRRKHLESYIAARRGAVAPSTLISCHHMYDETMNVTTFGRTSLVVAASDGPGG